MPQSRQASRPTKRKTAKRARTAQKARLQLDPVALVDLASAFTLLHEEEEVVRFAAPAVTSALAVPLGAMYVRGSDSDAGFVFGQLGSDSLHPTLVDELRDSCDRWSAGSSQPARPTDVEVAPDDASFRGIAHAGIKRLLVAPLRTLHGDFGAIIAGARSDDPFSATQHAALSALAAQSMATIRHIRADRERARLAERVQILDQLMRVAASSLNIDDVFEGISTQVKRLIDFDAMTVALQRAGDDSLQVHATAVPAGGPLRPGLRLGLDDASQGEVIRTGSPVVRRDVRTDGHYPIEFQVAEAYGTRSSMFIPLASRGRVFGSLNFASATPGRYGDQEVRLAQEIADHLAIVVEHGVLYEEAKQTATLEERTRLAREIHDTLAQSLTGIAMQLEAAEDELGGAAPSASAFIQTARHQARESLEEARRSVWDLQPAALESGALTDALRREAARLADPGLDVAFDVVGAPADRIDRRCEQALLRIAQETFNNIRQHAQAHSIRAVLEYRPSEISLRVSDDGVGFDPDRAVGLLSAGGGFGLSSMQERARLVDGQVEIRSTLGVGTEIVAVIPARPAADEPPVLTQTSVTANVPAVPAHRIRVLIADDHEIVRQGIRHMLEQVADIEVVGEAADGEEAIRQVQALSPHVLLLDLQMPTLDGVGALRRLREIGTSARTILFSVFANDEQIFEGLRAGARGYLVKDVARQDLTHAIRTVHEGGSLIPPVIADRLVERMDSAAGAQLTARERDILRQLATGARNKERNKEIATALSLSAGTVKWHISNLYQKLNVTTRTEAVRVAGDRGFLNA